MVRIRNKPCGSYDIAISRRRRVVIIKDWYDDWIEEGEMNVYILADPHFNHDAEGGVMETKCKRPIGFSQKIAANWRRTVQPNDLIIVAGDVFIGSAQKWNDLYPTLPGRKILIRGNHDRTPTCS